jgi:hypothetical protein
MAPLFWLLLEFSSFLCLVCICSILEFMLLEFAFFFFFLTER